MKEAILFNLKEKIQSLPFSPGVYLMKDSLGGILYVGKAKNLKKRVQSYFRSSANHSPKINKLVQHLKDFDYILVDTEFEAFMLECKLIKELKPPYNRIMKNPLSFAYIVIHMNDDLRRIEMTNNPKEQAGNLCFGPFTNLNTIEKGIHGILASFKVLCSNPPYRGSACLNSSLGLCNGMCLGGSALEQYRHIVNQIIALLNGTDKGILDKMTLMMLKASETFDFELAAKYRDYIDAVNTLINKERVIEFTEENNNIAIIEYLNDQTIKLFLIKRTVVLFGGKYELDKLAIDQVTTEIRDRFLTHFTSNVPPSAIEVSRDELDEAQIIYSYLKSNKCRYTIVPDKWLMEKKSSKLSIAILELFK
jgi:excinuclease ABC subunit C